MVVWFGLHMHQATAQHKKVRLMSFVIIMRKPLGVTFEWKSLDEGAAEWPETPVTYAHMSVLRDLWGRDL